MTISTGDSVPSVNNLSTMTADGPGPVSTDDLFKGKRVVLFAVPGAFTPTCSAEHLPGYIKNAAAIKGKGIDDIVCVSVNDVFVMDAWGKSNDAGEINMVADANGDLAREMGLELDLSGHGLGVRSARYAMVVNDGKVETLQVDEGGKLDVSSAESILATL